MANFARRATGGSTGEKKDDCGPYGRTDEPHTVHPCETDMGVRHPVGCDGHAEAGGGTNAANPPCPCFAVPTCIVKKRVSPRPTALEPLQRIATTPRQM